MGDSRSWAAEKESETKTCPHGHEYPYFGNCHCEGCLNDYSLNSLRDRLSHRLRNQFNKWAKSETPVMMQIKYTTLMAQLEVDENPE